VKYILSYDIKLKPWNLDRWGVSDKVYEKILSARDHQTYKVEDINITTYKSTDEGVAFMLETERKVIYHAGDLNWWLWEGESKQWNNNMTASFQREIGKMTSMSLDLAFLPLDPRQEGNYYLGIEYMLKNVNVKYVIPMHMWGEYAIIDRFKADGHLNGYDTEVIKINEEGQVIYLSL
jgi:L-ascorbate metabolism protein UlaG (beta-lactamase superfamily)